MYAETRVITAGLIIRRAAIAAVYIADREIDLIDPVLGNLSVDPRHPDRSALLHEPSALNAPVAVTRDPRSHAREAIVYDCCLGEQYKR